MAKFYEIEIEIYADEEEDDWDDCYDDGYASNAPCDNTGYCVGARCPYYYNRNICGEGLDRD